MEAVIVVKKDPEGFIGKIIEIIKLPIAITVVVFLLFLCNL
jgi:hypothetical protein